MIIKTNFDNLDSGIGTLVSIVTDKMASEALKNIIFSIHADGTVNLVAYNTVVTCYTPLTGASVVWGEGETAEDTYFQIKSDIIQRLATFKGLKMTKVADVEISTDGSNALMTIHEEPLDPAAKGAEKYKQTSQYRLSQSKFPSGIRKQLENNNLDITGVVMNTIDIDIYLSTLSQTIPSDTKDSMATRIMAKGDYIYTAPQLYFAVMKNQLADTFRDFILPSSAANFLKSYLTASETVTFGKEDLATGTVVLKFDNGISKSFINATSTKNALDCSAYLTHSNTGIVLDKNYFADLMKRAQGMDSVTLDITLKTDSATGTIMSKNWKQPLVFMETRLNKDDFADYVGLTEEGGAPKLNVNFSIRTEILNKMLFMFSNKFSDKVFLYFEPAAGNGIKMAVRDDTGIWQTKINTLTPKRGDFSWDEAEG